MKFDDFMNKVRQFDNHNTQWFMRHFYVLFFEIILVAVFLVFFANVINSINISADATNATTIERLLMSQNTSQLLIVFLILLNSFWLLFMFSGMLKIRSILKNMDFNLSRRRNDRHNDEI